MPKSEEISSPIQIQHHNIHQKVKQNNKKTIGQHKILQNMRVRSCL